MIMRLIWKGVLVVGWEVGVVYSVPEVTVWFGVGQFTFSISPITSTSLWSTLYSLNKRCRKSLKDLFAEHFFKLKKKAGRLRVCELLKVKESAIFKKNPIKTLLSRESVWMDGEGKWGRGENDDDAGDKMLAEADPMYYTSGGNIFSFSRTL